eukprot:1296408-Amphidinium_carterae.1
MGGAAMGRSGTATGGHSEGVARPSCRSQSLIPEMRKLLELRRAPEGMKSSREMVEALAAIEKRSESWKMAARRQVSKFHVSECFWEGQNMRSSTLHGSVVSLPLKPDLHSGKNAPLLHGSRLVEIAEFMASTSLPCSS